MNQNHSQESGNQSWAKQLQQIIKRRRMSVFMIVGAFLILLILYNVGNFIFLNQMANQMETGLGNRLDSIAKLSANIVENEFPESFSPTMKNRLSLSVIRGQLQDIRKQHQLEGLFIIDRNFNTVLDSYQDFELDITRTYLQNDAPWIEQAWQGIPSAGPLHTIQGQKFKSAYAPIHNLSGQVIGVLVAEANAYFFILLDRYFNTYFVLAVVSAGIFILFTTFLFYALRLLIQTQKKLGDTERLAMMGHMSAVLAHEIRNPLGIIRGTADILRSRYQKPDQPDPMFSYIPDEVNRLNKLVNNFLVLSRNTKPNRGKYDICKLIESTIEKIKTEENRDQVHFQVRTEQIAPFFFDADAVQQVIINLVRNSRQAIDSRGTITIEAGETEKRKNRYVRISVTDDGAGIEGDPQIVFEPFYSTKSSGSGLGMAVAKKIVAGHDGWMEIDSHIDKGTTVTFFLRMVESIED